MACQGEALERGVFLALSYELDFMNLKGHEPLRVSDSKSVLRRSGYQRRDIVRPVASESITIYMFDLCHLIL